MVPLERQPVTMVSVPYVVPNEPIVLGAMRVSRSTKRPKSVARPPQESSPHRGGRPPTPPLPTADGGPEVEDLGPSSDAAVANLAALISVHEKAGRNVDNLLAAQSELLAQEAPTAAAPSSDPTPAPAAARADLKPLPVAFPMAPAALPTTSSGRTEEEH